jgi:hypothetical protein
VKRLLGLATVLVLMTGTGAQADCYPPNPGNGSGHVDKTRVAPGECVTFSGNGFRPRTTVTVADNGAVVGATQANSAGEFSKQVCFGATSAPGQHELTGTGADKGGDKGGDCKPGNGPKERTVHATVFVLGAGIVAPPGGGSGLPREEVPGVGGVGGNKGSNGGGLPFTGDITALEAGIAMLLLLAGGAVLIAARPRRRSSSAA